MEYPVIAMQTTRKTMPNSRVFLVWGGIERYRKIWDDIYKMVLIASFSFIAVLGNLIREYLPFNLLFVIFVINVGAVLIRIPKKWDNCG